MTERYDQIMATVQDVVTDLLYYDRREDGLLPVGAIEEAILGGELTVDEIVDAFRDYLVKGVEL